MQKVRELERKFDALCLNYGLPKREYNYVSLLTIFVNRKIGGFPTPEEILSDFTALELARMLKQLSFSGGAFSLVVGGVKKDYNSPALVEVVKHSLEDALQARVKKKVDGNGGIMILYKVFGRKKRGFPFPYPVGCSPQEGGFSEGELDAIIAFEEGLAVEVKKMQGNKERWEEEGASRLPELGKLAEMIMQHYLPEDWLAVKKLNFVADFLFGAGFLDFKSELWKDEFKQKKPPQKDRMVRDWVKAYHTSQKKSK